MNPVAISIGPLVIRWYTIFILLAFALVCLFIFKEGKKFNLGKDFLFNMAFWTLIFGIIGARIYYVIFNWSYYGSNVNEIWKIWEGGLAIHGGLIAGALTIFIYTKKYHVNTFLVYDIVAVPLLLGQAIGRWGNFFNSEAHGAATTFATLKNLKIPDFIINGMQIDGIYYQPTFLYESLWCILGFIILLIVRRFKYIKIGQLSCLYIMWYSVGRLFIEASRTDSLMFGGFKMAQLVSILLFVIGLIIFVILLKKGKYEGLYNDIKKENINF